MPNSQIENPFTADRPVSPEFFVGRKKEVNSILSRISLPHNRGGSFISGVHGIGKSSLLNYLKSSQALALQDRPNLAPDKARFILLPGTYLTGFVEQEFWSFVFEDLQIWFEEKNEEIDASRPIFPGLQQRVEELAKPDAYRSPRQIEDCFDRLGQIGLACIVLLDNFGVLLGREDPANPRFFLKLRALLQKPGQTGFSLIATSQKTSNELFAETEWRGSRFDAGMQNIKLSGLTQFEVDELIDVNTKNLPAEYHFSEDEKLFIHAIREKTGGHPGKVQRAAYYLVERKLNFTGVL